MRGPGAQIREGGREEWRTDTLSTSRTKVYVERRYRDYTSILVSAFRYAPDSIHLGRNKLQCAMEVRVFRFLENSHQEQIRPLSRSTV